MAAVRIGEMGILVRRIVAVASAAIATAALSTSSGPAIAAPPVKGGALVLALGADAPTVNPDVSTGIPDQLIGCLLYQGMTKVSADLEIQPLLAKSWTVSDDGKTYKFELNAAKWHDGKPFT